MISGVMYLWKAVVVLFCLLLAGCGLKNGREAGIEALERQVLPVVGTYLECAAAGEWDQAMTTLSGEALAQARANSGRVKTRSKIISKSLKAVPVCRGITEVTADFTTSSGGGFDRLAYRFRLIETDGRWSIYQTTYGDYHYGRLRPGQLPPEAADMIRTYLELPFNRKRSDGRRYLAGKLLQESEKAGILPVDARTAEEQERIITRAGQLECLGISDNYAVARVHCEVVKNGVSQQMEALVETLDVNGAWKIARLDVSGF